jgi:small GTP-binding protein
MVSLDTPDEDEFKVAELHIWDTLGQEKFKSIAKIFFKGAIGAFLVFDVTNRKSFDDLEQWREKVIDSCGIHVTITVLGNKIDLGNREVHYNEAMQYARKYKMNYLEVSAKSAKNVKNAFGLLVRSIYKQQCMSTGSMIQVFKGDQQLVLSNHKKQMDELK